MLDPRLAQMKSWCAFLCECFFLLAVCFLVSLLQQLLASVQSVTLCMKCTFKLYPVQLDRDSTLEIEGLQGHRVS